MKSSFVSRVSFLAVLAFSGSAFGAVTVVCDVAGIVVDSKTGEKSVSTPETGLVELTLEPKEFGAQTWTKTLTDLKGANGHSFEAGLEWDPFSNSLYATGSIKNSSQTESAGGATFNGDEKSNRSGLKLKSSSAELIVSCVSYSADAN